MCASTESPSQPEYSSIEHSEPTKRNFANYKHILHKSHKTSSKWPPKEKGQKLKANLLLGTELKTETTTSDGHGHHFLFWEFQPEVYSSLLDPQTRFQRQQECLFILVSFS